MIDIVMINPLDMNPLHFIECAEKKIIINFNQPNGTVVHDWNTLERIKLWEPKELKANYCRDSVDLILLWNELKVTAPLVMHYKDFVPIIPSNANPIDWPLFNKVRDLNPGEERGGAVPPGRMYDAILCPFNGRRHFSTVWDVPKNDIPWHTKKGSKLLSRGDYNVASPMHLKKG